MKEKANDGTHQTEMEEHFHAPRPEDFQIAPAPTPTPKRDLITVALEARANERLKMELDTFQKHLKKHPLYAPISKMQVNISKGGLPFFNGTLYDFFDHVAPVFIKESMLESYIDEEAKKLLEKIDSL